MRERVEWAALPAVAVQKPTPEAKRIDAILGHDARHVSDAERLVIRDAVADSAHAHGVDPLLILALIRIESGFKTRAVSSAGALGLLQLQPKTAKWIAERVTGAPADGEASLLDPRVNVRLGVGYFSYLFRRFGSFALALEAYNRGPNAPDLFVKSLEEQHLADRFWQRVLAQYLDYRRIAGCGGTNGCSFDAPWEIGLTQHELALLFNEAVLDEQIL